jgi:hypothetical protein
MEFTNPFVFVTHFWVLREAEDIEKRCATRSGFGLGADLIRSFGRKKSPTGTVKVFPGIAVTLTSG